MEETRVGFIMVEVIAKGEIERNRMKDAFHVPKLQANLLSMSKSLNELKMQFNVINVF